MGVADGELSVKDEVFTTVKSLRAGIVADKNEPLFRDSNQ
jgi:hypothetical protein